MKSLLSTKKLAFSAMIAAMYVVLVMVGAGYAFGPVQFRAAEALTLLPFLFPEAIPGLFVGCALSNILSSYGLPDVIFGSLATLLAALLTARCRNRLIAAIPPVLINAVVIGLLITLFTPDAEVSMLAFLLNAASVGAGQLGVCFVLGVPMLYALERVDLRQRLRM